MTFIPVNTPLMNGNEEAYLLECVRSGWIGSEGPFVSEFEDRFASCVTRKHGVAVCNGSAALEVAVSALELGPGDEVIMPTFTIISCAAAIMRAGARPVLVDCDPVSWNLDVAQIEDRITLRTRAIMVVHIYGLPVNMRPLLEVADRHGLAIIEDAAEAHGLICDGRPCGSFGDISVFSFYPNKHVTTGEGGMLVTDDPLLAERCRSLRNLCFTSSRRFVHEELGWNFRMSNLQAALGVAQLEQLDGFVERKRRMGALYNKLLSGVKGIQLPAPETGYALNIYWVYGVVLQGEVPFDAAAAIDRLAEKGIGSRPFFWPMHEQPVFRKNGLFKGECHPVAERIARRGFYIPSGLALTDEEITVSAHALREILK